MTIREVKEILNARLHTPGADLDVQVHAACGRLYEQGLRGGEMA